MHHYAYYYLIQNMQSKEVLKKRLLKNVQAKKKTNKAAIRNREMNTKSILIPEENSKSRKLNRQLKDSDYIEI